MQLITFQYVDDAWTIDAFPDCDSVQTLVIIFAAPTFIHNPTAIQQLAAHYPQSKMIGCSSAGEIYGANIYDNSLSVAVIQFEKTALALVSLKINTAKDSFAAGEYLVNQLNNDDLRAIFVLANGLIINGSEFVKGLNVLQNDKVTITGGLAADDDKFQKTWAIINGEIVTEHMVAIGFYGDCIRVNHGSRGGWNIFGLERVVTRSENQILYELDYKPALSLYKDYLGEKAAGLPATGLLFPLAIRKNKSDPHQLVRTILAIDEEKNALIFGGDIPTGYLAQLMRANLERIIDGAAEASQIIVDELGTQTITGPILLLAVSCVGRRLLLGARTEEETEATLELFPEGTQQIGFYSYGELSSSSALNCDLHNQTMTLTSLYEDLNP